MVFPVFLLIYTVLNKTPKYHKYIIDFLYFADYGILVSKK